MPGWFKRTAAPLGDRTLISIHVPKASGTSFFAALRTAFAPGEIGQLYDDPADPTHRRWIAPARYFASRPTSLEPYRAVHGHIIASKYELVPDAMRITMLRDPVENLVSIYCYWQLLAERGHEGRALFKLFQAERLGLADLAEMPLLRRLMSQTYFGDVDMRRFTIVGDFADRLPFFRAVSRALGVELETHHRENVTPPSAQREALLADTRLLRRVRDLLADDVRFYERYRGRGCG